MKYAKPSDISTEAFLAAGRKAAGSDRGGLVYLWEIAWALSDYERPKTLGEKAPDVSEYAVRQKARRLDLLGHIREATGRPDRYFIPPAEDSE